MLLALRFRAIDDADARVQRRVAAGADEVLLDLDVDVVWCTVLVDDGATCRFEPLVEQILLLRSERLFRGGGSSLLGEAFALRP